jgi:hypothetical protein
VVTDRQGLIHRVLPVAPLVEVAAEAVEAAVAVAARVADQAADKQNHEF